jgi:BirA family biotin operon repressor/biotin-[acetyl-CoA-carboxylase] ligase
MIGQAVNRYDAVTSTNDIARELANSGASEGTVVVADEQTKGRGSRGRTWVSPPGVNLLVSVVFRPQIPPERIGELAFVAALAVAGTLRDCCGLDARIKWPNDVTVNGRNISGMIVEAAKGAAVLGIGLNINWTDLPEEIAATATSVLLERGTAMDLDAVLKALLADLDIAYGVYRARGFSRTLSDWRALEATTGSKVTISTGDETLSGLAVDFDEHGSLVIELPTGDRRTIPAATLVR